MDMKIVFVLLCMMAFTFAIEPAANWTIGTTGKYTPTTKANYTTEGGNVTNLNLNGNVSTERWAGFWGNVTNTIVLSPGTGIFYSWAWSPTNGGRVCAVPAASGFNWAAVAAVTNANINTLWGFGAAVDNSTNTLTNTTCGITVAGQTVSSVGNKTGVGGFQTCAISDSAVAAKSDFAFCVNIASAGSLFNGATGNYEVLVPTNQSEGTTETYYFWLDLA